jgi:hypothetical protein
MASLRSRIERAQQIPTITLAMCQRCAKSLKRAWKSIGGAEGTQINRAPLIYAGEKPAQPGTILKVLVIEGFNKNQLSRGIEPSSAIL